LLSVKDIGGAARGPIFLSSENQDLLLRDRASTEPVLDVSFEGSTPHFDKLPESRLFIVGSVKALNISHRWLIPSKHIDVSLLDRDSCRQISVSVELRLLSPAVVLN
jgi:hypothetical protein